MKKFMKSKCAPRDQNFFEIVNEAEDSIDYLEASLSRTIELRKRLSVSIVNQSGQGRTTPTEIEMSVSLPTIALPKFDGNPLEYKSYWDQFNNLVHQRNVADVTKFTHLLSTPQGKARAASEGLLVTNASCGEALDILRDRFGT
ncbi:unnamed protein product [Anisakis simplex]|uniref:Reverse transcriptase domain-containing protein n=1 Tax=Anisakis simplex TaxID=6269 RepID=A0A0M3K978_ANISI|nr:unnamed protein product [Anisakis simplex]